MRAMLFVSACAVAQVALALPAQAQVAGDQDQAGPSDAQEEIVVTGERRATRLDRTPIAATVLSGEDLANAGVSVVDQLQFVAPATTVNYFGQGTNFNIRGIGKSETNSQTLTGVIAYRDSVPSNPGWFTAEPYYDIRSLEILRGPQGTFVGANATGGAVLITSNAPVINGGMHGYVLGQAGNYNSLGGQGAVNIPIGDTMAARVALYADTRDSFYTYNADGQTTLIENGTVDSQSDPDWANFAALEAVSVSYDALGRRVRDSLIASGATHAVTQYSYDAENRPEWRCGSIRLQLNHKRTRLGAYMHCEARWLCFSFCGAAYLLNPSPSTSCDAAGARPVQDYVTIGKTACRRGRRRAHAISDFGLASGFVSFVPLGEGKQTERRGRDALPQCQAGRRVAFRVFLRLSIRGTRPALRRFVRRRPTSLSP